MYVLWHGQAARLPTVTAIKIPPGMDYNVHGTYIRCMGVMCDILEMTGVDVM